VVRARSQDEAIFKETKWRLLVRSYLCLHFVQVLIFRVELCADYLDLVDGFWGIAELAWGPEPVWAGRDP
jgi:hypothetical protein